MRFSVYQVSRKGGRPKNEDRMGYCYTRAAGLFALADGMGGHPEGEVASQMALQTLAAHFQREAKPTLKDPARFLAESIMAAHQALLRYAHERGLLDTPRTTIVACVVQGSTAYWSHCGDSRLYLVRGEQLLARTRDHSYSELHGSGNLPPATAAATASQAANRNVLFTCLGSPGRPVVDTGGPAPMQPGDRIMLCSDGLWGAVNDAAILDVLCKRSVTDAVPELAEQALRTAGARSDNVTVLALEFEGDDHADAAAAAATRASGDEIFASTIQASVSAPGDASGDLDEAEIERSIREINEAIRRASQRRV
ncbi:PP2C family protein-serine/threonine phosphatase [Pseudaquabacterium rugosum]|jgi:serine/threonine protein phosphatase PrpC|uniref:PP2C family serine/threonine-protein phosphatase n=1 Tax=Pseudaquabacterium rugosum TaxID=2984194 RepID=A0ABU9BI10_9BURK